MVAYLLDERKTCVFIKIVARESEMMVECSPGWCLNVVAVGINAKIHWWFGFPYVLGVRTEYAVAEVDGVETSAVQTM